MDEIKKCPWCPSDWQQQRVVSYADLFESYSGSSMVVECLTCDALGPKGDSREDAIKRWNQRSEWR